MEKTSFWGYFFRSTRPLILLLLFLIGLVVLGISIVEYALYRFSSNVDSVRFTAQGATILMKNEEKKAVFTLPASEPWMNTGIYVQAGERLYFQVSGRIQMDIDGLARSAKNYEKPLGGWASAEKGLSIIVRPNKDEARTKMLVHQNSNLGTVIGHIQKGGEPNPGICCPRPSNRFIVQPGTPFVAEQSGFLWLCVNDFLLSPTEFFESQTAFLGFRKTKTEKRLRLKQWDKIVAANYWNVWFDDNVGDYLVQITFGQSDTEPLKMPFSQAGFFQ